MDIGVFSAIAQREGQPYYMFEICRLYYGESCSEKGRHIVSKLLTSKVCRKLTNFYKFEESRPDLLFFLKDDILEIGEPKLISRTRELPVFIGNLRLAVYSVIVIYGKLETNPNMLHPDH